MRIITLLTDYGLKDSYVAEMKGTMLKINPNIMFIDISHSIEKFDIREGAFLMARSIDYFPEDAIHVAVVDPGVGSKRPNIIFETEKTYLIGPDNGLLAPAAEKLGIKKVYNITNRHLLPNRVSDVFDGRDTFGPVAAYLSLGRLPKIFGPETLEYERISSYSPPKYLDNILEASIIHIDGFGNLITNITIKELTEFGIDPGSEITLKIDSRTYKIPYVKNFSSVSIGKFLALVAGGGYLEFCINQGNAQKTFDIKRDEKIKVHFSKNTL